MTDGELLAYLAHPMGFHGAKSLSRWSGGIRKGRFIAVFDGHFFQIKEYGNRNFGYGRMWAIARRARVGDRVVEVLAFDVAPIFFSDAQMAKAVAIVCHPKPHEEADGLHWIPATGGVGYRDALKPVNLTSAAQCSLPAAIDLANVSPLSDGTS